MMKYVYAFFGFVAVVGVFAMKVAKATRDAMKVKRLQSKVDTTERIQDAPRVSDGDIATARKQLERLSKKR